MATEFGDYFDKLANMFEQIGYNLSRLRRYPRLYPDNEQLMKALVEVYKHVIKFCTKARAVFTEGKSKKGRCKISKSDAILMTKLTGVRKVFESTGLRTAMKLLWKPFKQQFGDTQDGMAFYIDIIELEVSAAEKEEAHNERAKAENERVLQTVHRQKNERHLEDAERFFEGKD